MRYRLLTGLLGLELETAAYITSIFGIIVGLLIAGFGLVDSVESFYVQLPGALFIILLHCSMIYGTINRKHYFLLAWIIIKLIARLAFVLFAISSIFVESININNTPIVILYIALIYNYLDLDIMPLCAKIRDERKQHANEYCNPIANDQSNEYCNPIANNQTNLIPKV